MPLSNLPLDTRLYIVGFKQGRTDLFFKPLEAMRADGEVIRRDDLVIVEADRGKDVGRVLNDALTVESVRNFIAVQANEAAGASAPSSGGPSTPGLPGAASAGTNLTNGPAPSAASSLGSRAAIAARSINPKRLYSKASPSDTSLLASKAADEERALAMCIAKVSARNLPMRVLAAELQWDRRKLTFYYTAASRVDFRALVADLFKIWKLRVWMFDVGNRRDQRDWLNLGGGPQMPGQGMGMMQQQSYQTGMGMDGGGGQPRQVPDWGVQLEGTAGSSAGRVR